MLKTVSASDPGDRWYYRLRNVAVPFEVNIDRDTADPSRVTAFSNFRVEDRDGRLIGAIGLGVDVRDLSRELSDYQQRYGAQVLLVARDGRVLLPSDGPSAAQAPASLQAVPGLAPPATGAGGWNNDPAGSGRVQRAATMHFQDIISSLNQFWAAQGCLLLQPYDTEKGAGTMSPHTVLRAIGPEPWAVAYPEPCRRPTDGRYGENPNRAQHYFQYQVLIKPSPDGIQETYLASLEALGIRAADHDIRFVEDNWESPTLGAWGVGWEVWLDGMEVTQFTYFQQCGGLDCRPVSIEITYGLERLAMYLQDVESIWDLHWNAQRSYGEIWLPFEKGQCAYNFEASNPERLQQLFALYEAEAADLVARKLPAPALDFVLKCSHTFNLLEARGVISVTERTATIGRIRHLARQVAQAWLEEREALGFPLLATAATAAPQPAAVAGTASL